MIFGQFKKRGGEAEEEAREGEWRAEEREEEERKEAKGGRGDGVYVESN